MNARLPTFTLVTANPELDAARHDNDRENSDEWSQEAMRQAPLIIQRQLDACRPADWFKCRLDVPGSMSPDEVINDAVIEDPDAATALAELMASPAAQPLRKLAAAWVGKKYHLDIYQSHLEPERESI